MPAGPRLARWLLARTLPRGEARRLIDALDDEYATHQRRDRGLWRAHLWYWRQALFSIRPLRSRVPDDLRPGLPILPAIGRDLRLAVRSARRAPAFALAAVLTLTIGIGATTAIFSVVHAVAVRDLPYADPDRIVRGWTHSDRFDIRHFSFRVVEYRAFAERRDLVDAVGGEFPVSLPLVREGQEPRQVQGRRVTPDFFRVFGVQPAVGRMFDAAEIAGGSSLVVVVTHPFWIRDLGARPDAVGQSIDLGGRAYTVVGVLPDGYRHVSGDDAEFFMPYTIGTSSWIGRWLDVYARLRPGVTVDTAAAAWSATLADLAAGDARNAGWQATVEPLRDVVFGDARPVVFTAFAMAGLVLLVACLNVANLTLARGTGRGAELALRVALGASRTRILTSLFVESLLLAATGGALGVALAGVGVRAIGAAGPAVIPRLNDLSLVPGVLWFALAVTAGTTVLAGLLPALRATRGLGPGGAADDSRATSRATRFSGPLGSLVVVEVALALTLMVGAGLMVRTFRNLDGERFGFERTGALTFAVNAPPATWPSEAGTLSFYGQLQTALRALPGVTAVGAAANLPLVGAGAVAGVTTEALVASGADSVTVLQRRAGPGFFAALGTRIRAGREFDERDTNDRPLVAIVSASLAERLYPGESAVGRRVAFGRAPAENAWMTIVGVVDDVRYRSAHLVGEPQIYQAHGQSVLREMSVVVRTSGDPAPLIPAVRAAVSSLDPRVPVYEVRTLGDIVSAAVGDRRFAMWLFTLFSLTATVLAVGGIYGVLAFGVGRRRREIGVRLALGATRADVVRRIVGEGMALVAAGVIVGTVLAAAGARWLTGLLYGVTPTDELTWAAVLGVVTVAGAAACILPARRAARLDPVQVLRRE